MRRAVALVAAMGALLVAAPVAGANFELTPMVGFRIRPIHSLPS